ncbi:hypothetical protein B296_00044384 [Ensete ventricosum]|uniref:GTD-binding domain-containing protein n=1 Tax=Ensete ventricosum TaxID=4639 RepID=A0A426ZB64_ENSVE|nr:hypothetical protein B296_00044384 [Ensete ventricosum]
MCLRSEKRASIWFPLAFLVLLLRLSLAHFLPVISSSPGDEAVQRPPALASEEVVEETFGNSRPGAMEKHGGSNLRARRFDAFWGFMDPGEPTPMPDGSGGGGTDTVARTCASGCHYFGPASVPSAAWYRSLKRKLDERDAETCSLSFVAKRGDEGEGEGGAGASFARVDIGNEAAALREALISHQQSVQKLLTELEEERSAAASAATEAMSMILRLQREKAEAQMEARQFKRLADEKMAHDQQEIASLEDLLFKRDQAVQALSCEVQAYRHRLLSYGIGIDGDAPPSEPQTPDTATSAAASTVRQFDLLPRDYPPLRCTGDAAADLDKYPSGGSPRERLHTLDKRRIFQLERMPSSSFSHVMDKGIVVGQSPRRRPRHLRSWSYRSFASGQEFKKGDEFPAAVDCASDYGGRDDMSDRVYTVDAVHGASDDYVSTPRELQNRRIVGGVGGGAAQEAEVRKLCARMEALEADRESMRQSFISMGTDKAQLVLLKEIAQQMCKEVAPERNLIKKPPSNKRFSIMSVIRVLISFIPSFSSQ